MVIKKNISFLLLKILFTFLMFMNLLNVKNYNSFSLILLVIISIFFYDYDFKRNKKVDKKNNKIYLVFSILFAITQVLGHVVYKYQFSRDVSILKVFFNINNLINVCGLFVLCHTLISNFVPRLLKVNIFSKCNYISSWKIFLFCFSFIFICWIPYFLTLFPGVLTSDSTDQFSRVVNGFKIVSDHHPVIHTLFIGIVYKIGFLIFNNPLFATAFVSIVQMAIMSCIFSYLILFLYKKNVSKYILVLVLINFAFSPIHGYYSVTMWKDVLFSGLFLLFILYIIKVDEHFSFKLFDMIGFIILSLLFLFFRNNALYVYVFTIPFLIYLYRDKLMKILLCFLVSLGCYFVVKGPVFTHFNIRKSSSSEYIAIPLQQIGRMAYKYVDFTDDEISLIDDLMPVEVMSSVYNPMTVDSIKFNKLYHKDMFDSNKSKYFKLWFQLVLKHPSIAVESYLSSTLGYWYSNVEFWATADSIYTNDMDIYSSPKGGKLINAYVKNSVSRNIPIISLQWSIGLCFIFIWFSVLLLFVQKKFRSLFYYVPLLGVWLTLMIATPVFAEFRYIYCAFTSLPLFLILPFLNIKKESK